MGILFGGHFSDVEADNVSQLVKLKSIGSLHVLALKLIKLGFNHRAYFKNSDFHKYM